MGLREKVALAMLITFSTQIFRNHSMPHDHLNYLLKSCTKNAKSSELILFPDVEYPSDYQAGEYYRFLSDYPVQHQPKICTNKSTPQTQNYGREAKFKRKYDVATNIKAKPEIAASFTECDSISHPYCFRRSSFFPEVEYPLSARDTWIPTFWNRLQDARRHSNVQKEKPSLSSTTQISNHGTGYSNSALNSLIKTLNTKKDSALTKPISDTFPVSNVSDTSDVFSSDIDPDTFIPRKDSISTINNSNHSVTNRESIISTKNMPCGIVTTTTNTEINGSNLYISREENFDDPVSKTTTTVNSDILLQPSDHNNEPFDHIVATTSGNNDIDLYFLEESVPNNTVSTTIQANNSDISLGPSVINRDHLDHIVARTTNPINNSITPELPIINEDKDNNKPAISTFKNDPFVDSITTTENTKNSDETLFEEDKNPLYNTVSDSSISKHDPFGNNVTATANTRTQNDATTESPKLYEDTGPEPEKSIMKTDLLSDIGTTATNTIIGDIIPELSITKENKVPFNDIISTLITATDGDTNSAPRVSDNEPFGDIVTTTSQHVPESILKENYMKQESSIFKNDPFVDSITTTENTKNSDETLFKEDKNPLYNTVSDSSISKHDPFGDNVTTTSKPIIGDVPESILKENDMEPKSSIFNNDPPSNILTSTNSDILHEGKAQSDIVSSKTSTILTDHTPGSSVTMNDPLGDILISNTNTRKFNIGPEVPQLTESKATFDKVLPTTKSATNSVIQPDSSFTKNIPREGITTSPTNTTDTQTPDMPIFKEDKGPCVNNVTIKPATPILNNGLLNAENVNFDYIMLPTVPDYTGNTTQDLATNVFEPVYFMVENNINEGSIPGVNDTIGLIFYMDDSNSTLEYEYVDDTSVSCTEIPYDFIMYPEYVNDTWSAFANDSYVSYQPICDYSDDICLLFIDTNGTLPSGDII